MAGPGRYRLRVHVKNREGVNGQLSAEEHYLLIWPAAEPRQATLLTPMDSFGLAFGGAPQDGAPQDGAPHLDWLELAAGRAVGPVTGAASRQLAIP